MNFQSKGMPLDERSISQSADLLKTSPRALWTVLLTETNGFGYLADRRPRILFERHYFQRLTSGRFDAVAPDLSAKEPGGYRGGQAEYERLTRAIALDETAALQSASWGIGQIMGANFAMLGYSTVQQMVRDFVDSEAAQLFGMAKFIISKKLATAIQQQDWAAFAKGYNGPDYQKNQYDTKLASRYDWLAQSQIDLSLRRAQAALLYLGYQPGAVDGLAGNKTRAALQSFQQQNQLAASGDANSATLALLEQRAFS